MAVTRRKVLKGGTALAGGMAAILATGRAPAFAQGTTVHWLRWNDFVPASDQLLRREMLPEGEKALGIKINFETVNANDLQPRITSAIQSGSGPDLIMLNNNHPQLYAASCVDLSRCRRGAGQGRGRPLPARQGEFQRRQEVALDAVGHHRRHDRLSQIVVRRGRRHHVPRHLGEVSRGRQEAQGQGPARSARRSATPSAMRRRSAIPSCGRGAARRSRKDGKIGRINSKETVDSVKFMTGFWKDAHDEGGLAWDDSNNNRAFLSQTISATLNGASIYIESLRNPDKYITEKGAQLKTDILHAPLPKGPAGQFSMHTYHSHVLPTYSKNQKAAKNFLKWAHSKPVYEKWFISQKGFATPPHGRVGEAQGVGRGSGHDALQDRGPPRPHAWLRRPGGRESRRGALQVHHHRHVREGRARACRPRTR